MLWGAVESGAVLSCVTLCSVRCAVCVMPLCCGVCCFCCCSLCCWRPVVSCCVRCYLRAFSKAEKLFPAYTCYAVCTLSTLNATKLDPEKTSLPYSFNSWTGVQPPVVFLSFSFVSSVQSVHLQRKGAAKATGVGQKREEKVHGE